MRQAHLQPPPFNTSHFGKVLHRRCHFQEINFISCAMILINAILADFHLSHSMAQSLSGSIHEFCRLLHASKWNFPE